MFFREQPLTCFSQEGRFLNILWQYWQKISTCSQCFTSTCRFKFCLQLFSFFAAGVNSHSLQLQPFSVLTINRNAAEKVILGNTWFANYKNVNIYRIVCQDFRKNYNSFTCIRLAIYCVLYFFYLFFSIFIKEFRVSIDCLSRVIVIPVFFCPSTFLILVTICNWRVWRKRIFRTPFSFAVSPSY